LNGGPRVRINSPLVDGVLGNLAEFGGDIASLAELQAELGVADLKEATRKATLPAAAVAVAIPLALGGVLVLLLGAVEGLVLAGMTRVWALVVVGLAALIVAGVLGWLAARGLANSFESFRRSREELARNVAWIKTVLAYSGRAKPQRR